MQQLVLFNDAVFTTQNKRNSKHTEIHLEMAATDTEKLQILGQITSNSIPSNISVTAGVTDGLTSCLCTFFSFMIYLATLLATGCKTWSYALKKEHRLC